MKEYDLIPDEFDYKKELKTYKKIGNKEYEKKNPNDYCQDYSSWSNHIRKTINKFQHNDLQQLRWSIERHKNFQQQVKDAWTSIGLSIVMFIIGFVVQKPNQDVNFYLVLAVAVVAEITMILPIGIANIKMEFDDDVIKAIDKPKTRRITVIR